MRNTISYPNYNIHLFDHVNTSDQGVLSAIGNTPLVKLNRLFSQNHFQTFAKLEALNPGGSMKDRAAFNIVKNALEKGLINADSTIIESSSGNMGIGLAQACRYYGIKFICVVDIKTTEQNKSLLRAYGARIEIVTEPDPETNELLQARLKRVQTLLGQISNSWWPNQYSNLWNAEAHQHTMHEIANSLEAMSLVPDIIMIAAGTCGTLRGCSDYIRQNHMPTRIYAVDALGSIIFGINQTCKRLIPGHGAARRPELYREGMAQRVIYVSDLDCVMGCRQLAEREAILAGGSSGALVAALTRIQSEIPVGATCVMILPDRGERYIDTIYSDDWVHEHFDDTLNLMGTSVSLDHSK